MTMTMTMNRNSLELPSGAIIDVDRPDFSKCQSEDDFLEIKYALSEKIIGIELQLDMFENGAGVLAGRTYSIDWKARTSAALKWAKLYRDEVQNRQGSFSRKQKAIAAANSDTAIVNVIRSVLSKDEFMVLVDLSKRAATAALERGRDVS